MSEPTQARLLTDRQSRFVDEYLVDLNATKAAIRAGYSAKTAASQGERLLRNVEVAGAIEKRKVERSAATGITQERVLRELAVLAFSDVTHYQVDENGRVTLAEGAPEGALRAISSIKHKTRSYRDGDDTTIEHEVEVKLWDKTPNLKLAGRHVATPGFYEKLEVTGKDGKDLVPPEASEALAALAAIGIKPEPKE